MAKEELERLNQARAKCSRADTWVLRSIVLGWREVDEVTIIGAPSLAQQFLAALDALAILHGEEDEARQLDETMARIHRQDAGIVPPAPGSTEPTEG